MSKWSSILPEFNKTNKNISLAILLFISLLVLWKTIAGGFNLHTYAGYDINGIYGILASGHILLENLAYSFGYIIKAIFGIICDANYVQIYHFPFALIAGLAINYALFLVITKERDVSLLFLGAFIAMILGFDLNSSHVYGFILAELVLLVTLLFYQKKIKLLPFSILIILLAPTTYFASYNAGAVISLYLVVLLFFLVIWNWRKTLGDDSSIINTKLLFAHTIFIGVMIITILSDGWVWDTFMPFLIGAGDFIQNFFNMFGVDLTPTTPTTPTTPNIDDSTISKDIGLFATSSTALGIASLTNPLRYLMMGGAILANIIISAWCVVKSKVNSGAMFTIICINTYVIAFLMFGLMRLLLSNPYGAQNAIMTCSLLSLALIYYLSTMLREDNMSKIPLIITCASLLTLIAIVALASRYHVIFMAGFVFLTILFGGCYYLKNKHPKKIRHITYVSLVLVAIVILTMSVVYIGVIKDSSSNISESGNKFNDYTYSYEYYDEYMPKNSNIYSDIQTLGFLNSYGYYLDGERKNIGSCALSQIMNIINKKYQDKKTTFFIADYTIHDLAFSWQNWDERDLAPIQENIENNDILNKVYSTRAGYVIYNVI